MKPENLAILRSLRGCEKIENEPHLVLLTGAEIEAMLDAARAAGPIGWKVIEAFGRPTAIVRPGWELKGLDPEGIVPPVQAYDVALKRGPHFPNIRATMTPHAYGLLCRALEIPPHSDSAGAFDRAWKNVGTVGPWPTPGPAREEPASGRDVFWGEGEGPKIFDVIDGVRRPRSAPVADDHADSAHAAEFPRPPPPPPPLIKLDGLAISEQLLDDPAALAGMLRGALERQRQRDVYAWNAEQAASTGWRIASGFFVGRGAPRK